MDEGYAICLNEWALDKEIKNELGLLLIISSLTAEKGYCYASNEYLAKLFDLDETQISKKIAKLVKKGYLDVSYKRRGTEIISRELRLSKMTTDHCQKSQPTDVKNDKENNINNKNIILKRNIKEKEFISPSLGEVEQYIASNKYNVDAKAFWDYFEVSGWVDSKGNKVKNWKQKIITWHNHNTTSKNNNQSKVDPLDELLEEMKKNE